MGSDKGRIFLRECHKDSDVLSDRKCPSVLESPDIIFCSKELWFDQPNLIRQSLPHSNPQRDVDTERSTLTQCPALTREGCRTVPDDFARTFHNGVGSNRPGVAVRCSKCGR